MTLDDSTLSAAAALFATLVRDEPGIARWPVDQPLPEEWFSTDASSALQCDLCAAWVTALWPLMHYPADVNGAALPGDWMVCRACAAAVRPTRRAA